MADKPEWAIAIGGSAGALAPIQSILKALPADLPAAIFIAVHTAPDSTGYFAELMSRAAHRPVRAPHQPEDIRAGIYVAAPNRHLKITGEQVELTLGPREHHSRPAVDVLFRSAARAFGRRTIAVLLSGHGSDGAGGIVAVNARHGIVIVQDPDDAEVATMPRSAMATGRADYVLPAAAIAETLVRLAGGHEHVEREAVMISHQDSTTDPIERDVREQEAGSRDGRTSVVTCPDCGGVLWQANNGALVNFACHIGHRYGPDTLLVQKTEDLEAALVAALRLLREKAMLLRQSANRARAMGNFRSADRLEEQASVDDAHAVLLVRELLETEPSSLNNANVARDVQEAHDVAREHVHHD